MLATGAGAVQGCQFAELSGPAIKHLVTTLNGRVSARMSQLPVNAQSLL